MMCYILRNMCRIHKVHKFDVCRNFWFSFRIISKIIERVDLHSLINKVILDVEIIHCKFSFKGGSNVGKGVVLI